MNEIAIASTFTAEPLAPVLEYWCEERKLESSVTFAPFDQVLQTLVDPGSPFYGDRPGLNVIALRFEDLGAHGHGTAPVEAARAMLREIIDAAKAAATRSKRPLLVVACPASPGTPSYAELEAELARECERAAGLYFLDSTEIQARYPSPDYHDVYGAREARLPYTERGFAAIATMIARRFAALRRRTPHKVIVLDCDQTMWRGVVGEDGHEGIVIDDARRSLQVFMAEQKTRYGMLLAMCSKNAEGDVLEVFARRSDMVLKREDFVGWRINWERKSENLHALAKELGLGLDSFIFVDDDPVQCAEVRAGCPGVLVLQAPIEPADLVDLLLETWEFDHVKVTDEDRRRTEMYAQNREREALRAAAPSLDDYLATLGLEVTIAPVTDEQLGRVAQLTQRTNQFNCGNVKRTEAELKQLTGEMLSVVVRDRFGDYGLVGAVVFEARGEALEVDTFLLSCRVLGRKVEHTILERLRAEARARRLNHVGILFKPTAKNQPAADFLAAAAAARTVACEGGGSLHVFLP